MTQPAPSVSPVSATSGASPDERLNWFQLTFIYHWWMTVWWFRRLPNKFIWWVAWKLPRKVALYAFVRVYGVIGDIGPGNDYARAYKLWEAGHGR